jgi:hypothetical protein
MIFNNYIAQILQLTDGSTTAPETMQIDALNIERPQKNILWRVVSSSGFQAILRRLSVFRNSLRSATVNLIQRHFDVFLAIPVILPAEPQRLLVLQICGQSQ